MNNISSIASPHQEGNSAIFSPTDSDVPLLGNKTKEKEKYYDLEELDEKKGVKKGVPLDKLNKTPKIASAETVKSPASNTPGLQITSSKIEAPYKAEYIFENTLEKRPVVVVPSCETDPEHVFKMLGTQYLFKI
jgi:hypothetical protein